VACMAQAAWGEEAGSVMQAQGRLVRPLTPSPLPQDLCGSYTFIPYAVTPQNKVVCWDTGAGKCLTELFQPSFEAEAAFTPLATRLVQLLEGIPTDSWYCCPPLGCGQPPTPAWAARAWPSIATTPKSPTPLPPPSPAGIFGRRSGRISGGHGSCTGASS